MLAGPNTSLLSRMSLFCDEFCSYSPIPPQNQLLDKFFCLCICDVLEEGDNVIVKLIVVEEHIIDAP